MHDCRGFKRRNGKSIGAVAPTDGIACPHGELMPESRGGRARRFAVPPSAWRHFRSAWRQQERRRAEKAAEAAANRRCF